MLKAISTYVQLREQLRPGILDRMAGGGVAGIEIFAITRAFRLRNAAGSRDRLVVRRARGCLAALDPCADLRLRRVGARQRGSAQHCRTGSQGANRAMDEIKRAIEVAETMPFHFLILHIGVAGERLQRAQIRRRAELDGASARLCQAAQRKAAAGKHSERTHRSGETRGMIHTLHYDDVGVCFDLGHAHLEPG